MADKIKYLGQEGLRTLINKIADVSVISVSKAQYDALTPAEKQDRTFCINDWTPDETLGGSYNGPIGEIISYMGTTAPNNFLVCDGSIYNISDYIDLANHINKHFGSFNFFGGDGTTTFAVPDLRGEFLRGSGTNGHADSGNGANVGVHQNGTQIPNAWNYNGTIAMSYKANTGINTANIDRGVNKLTATLNEAHVASVTTGSGGYDYSHYIPRPTNTSVLYCIRYREAGNGGTVSTKGRIDGVIYINDIPVAASKVIDCYVDSINGNDDTGDGSSNKPFRTWGKARSLIPMGKCNVNYYFKGNFDDILISNKLGTFNAIDSPTFKKLDFADCDIMTFGSFTVDYSSATTVSNAAYVLNRSNIRAVTGKTTIIGRKETSYDMRGLQADNGSVYVNTAWDGASIEIRNCVRGCTPITGSKVCINSTKMTFTNCANLYDTAAGGTYVTT